MKRNELRHSLPFLGHRFRQNLRKIKGKHSFPLLQVPLIILRIIIENLYQCNRDDFYNFRLVSRTFRFETEYLLFSKIKLHDGTKKAKLFGLSLMEKLSNADGNIGEHVRRLIIGPFKDKEFFNSSIRPSLDNSLRNIKQLQSLIWYTHLAMPSATLDLFHRTHSSARLHWLIRDRPLEPLSYEMLSSPQLYTFDASIYRTDAYKSLRYSEFPAVKASLGKSLRVLRICSAYARTDNHEVDFIHWKEVQAGPAEFDWRDGDSFADLEELVLEHNAIDLTLENCEKWAKATSWAHLRRLELGEGSPRYFFASLAGRAVNLEYLKFHITEVRRTTWDLHPWEEGFPMLTEFIKSITALCYLKFSAHYLNPFTKTLDMLLENTGGDLRGLTLRCGEWLMPAWNTNHYYEVFDRTPGLESFYSEIKYDIFEGEWMGTNRYLTAKEKYETLAHSKALETFPDPFA